MKILLENWRKYLDEGRPLEDPIIHSYRQKVWKAKELLGDDFSDANVALVIAKIFPELSTHEDDYEKVYRDLVDMAQQQAQYDAEMASGYLDVGDLGEPL